MVYANNNDIGIYSTFHIQVSTKFDAMNLSFDMLHQGTVIQELESMIT